MNELDIRLEEQVISLFYGMETLLSQALSYSWKICFEKLKFRRFLVEIIASSEWRRFDSLQVW